MPEINSKLFGQIVETVAKQWNVEVAAMTLTQCRHVAKQLGANYVDVLELAPKAKDTLLTKTKKHVEQLRAQRQSLGARYDAGLKAHGEIYQGDGNADGVGTSYTLRPGVTAVQLRAFELQWKRDVEPYLELCRREQKAATVVNELTR